MFDALDIGASALTAQRVRMDTIAGNVANINTTRNAQGQRVPYQRRFVVFTPGRAARIGLFDIRQFRSLMGGRSIK